MMTKTSTPGPDMVSNLSNLLPTGTFLAFQTLAPLFTNSGQCGGVEKVMTSLLIGIFEFICFVLSLSDSITDASGKVHYGIVTSKGLFNPQFNGCGLHGVEGMFYNDSSGKYLINVFDVINGILNVVTFSALALLADPVTTCFYPGISSTITKTVPILVGIFVGMYFAFAPHARHGIGSAHFINVHDGLASENKGPVTTLKPSKKVGDKGLLFVKGGNGDNSFENPIFEISPAHSFTSPSGNIRGTTTSHGSQASSPIH